MWKQCAQLWQWIGYGLLALLLWGMLWSVAAAQVDEATLLESPQPYVLEPSETQPLEDIAGDVGMSAPPLGTGVSPALQGALTPLRQHRFKLSLSENDVFLSDRGLSQYLEILYSAPLEDTLTLNTALKFEMVTPRRTRYLTPEGEERCCDSAGIYHYPLYLEGQWVRREALAERFGVRASGHVRAGIDAPEAIGGPLQNAWHDLLGMSTLDASGDAAFYGGLGGSVVLEGQAGPLSYLAGPSVHLTTLQRSAGVLGGVGLDLSPVTLQAFATAEWGESRYFTEGFEPGYRVVAGLSAALALRGAQLGGWTPVLGMSVLYDYNSAVPDLSNVRYTFIPDLQLVIPVGSP